MLHFTESQIQSVLTYETLIPALRKAFIAYSAGEVIQPVRTVLSIPQHTGWFATMPAVYGDVMGAKLVTFYPHNAGTTLHTHMAVIQLFNAKTGEPLASMDGRLITEMRTAAVSAIAVDLLARREPRVLAILGSGIQARSHFKALCTVRSFDEVRVWSRTPAHAQAFADEIGAVVFSSAEQCVQDADVILTLTSSPTPILEGRWLKPTAMVCAVGAVTPDRRELDSDCMAGPIIVESRAAASREPGDILLAGASITAELGELLAGRTLTPSTYPTIFKSLGIAIEDIAAAKLVYESLSVVSRTA
jgi:ornithine cyclodeaminase/alanine dehydrogenase-like protein (mu-crystallin family)